MVHYALALGVVTALQGATASALTAHVPEHQYPPADACHPMGVFEYNEGAYPPCLSHGEIEGKCAPPTQDAAGFAFQRDCMCKGSFFQDVIGCSACKTCHALQTHEESAQWDHIFTRLQASYCKAGSAPTQSFQELLKKARFENGEPAPYVGDQRDRCVEPDNISVDAYYKNRPAKQGPGREHPGKEVAKEASECTKAPKQAPVEIESAAGKRTYVVSINATASLPAGPKYSNSTVSASSRASAQVSVYGIAVIECPRAVFVGGTVQLICGPAKMMSSSDASVPAQAKAGALDFSACSCANDFLAAKYQKLRPVPAATAAVAGFYASVSAESHAFVRVFSPDQCVGSCGQPVPVEHKSTVQAQHKPKPDCIIKAAATAAHAIHNVTVSPIAAGKSAPAAASVEKPAGAPAKKPTPAAADDHATPAAKASVGISLAEGHNAGAAAATGVAHSKGAAAGTGVPKVTIASGAGSKGVSAAVLAVAFAIYAL